jgi:hypothetical protein
MFYRDKQLSIINRNKQQDKTDLFDVCITKLGIVGMFPPGTKSVDLRVRYVPQYDAPCHNVESHSCESLVSVLVDGESEVTNVSSWFETSKGLRMQ